MRLFVALLLSLLTLAGAARAQDDLAARIARGAAALREGRVSDAIATFEALADQGVVDAAASYDRGLSYAARVRIGAEVPGDLGRAAQGFEEARDLAADPRLVEDATRALTLVRSEVARRRAQAGEPIEVDPGRSLGRTVAHLLAEDTWSIVAVASSAALSLALLLRVQIRARRLRIAAGVSAGLAAPVLLASIAMTMAARHDRLDVREAVVVTSTARPGDERGIPAPGATPLPEGTRVEIVEGRGAFMRVRFGALDAWIPAGALRELAK